MSNTKQFSLNDNTAVRETIKGTFYTRNPIKQIKTEEILCNIKIKLQNIYLSLNSSFCIHSDFLKKVVKIYNKIAENQTTFFFCGSLENNLVFISWLSIFNDLDEYLNFFTVVALWHALAVKDSHKVLGYN